MGLRRACPEAFPPIGPTRSAAEIRAVLGDRRVEKWVSDCFTAQLKAPAKEFQLCLAHQPETSIADQIFPKQSWQSSEIFFRESDPFAQTDSTRKER